MFINVFNKHLLKAYYVSGILDTNMKKQNASKGL